MEKYPTKLDESSLSKAEWTKQRTLELYSYLPQTSLEDRFQYTDIRDEVIKLNYSFFGYVAYNTYVANTSADYEDKFQSALMHFCNIWHKYQFKAKYRTDLAFSVFFKPRLSEEIQREFSDVRYATERTLKIKAGDQLGKHWAKVTYDDLKNVKLKKEEMDSLKAIFGCVYWADMENHEMFIESPDISGEFSTNIESICANQYDSTVDLIIHYMLENECLVDDSALLKLAEINDIPFETLKEYRPIAEATLRKTLMDNLELKEIFHNQV